ncbi:hypothetical protein [Psychrobacter sp.]|uniref:hypothetical protein n=1 Tax=Psychrobacter sp. TaxID=56811 RepID=UPI0025DFF766|nr:hypothetical protein [Psychrobacter sp.]
MNFRKRLANFLISDRETSIAEHMPTINDVHRYYETTNPFELGTSGNSSKPLRTRKQIYTLWEIMQTDPQIAEALSLHVTAALGGHESTGDMIFITPKSEIRTGGRRAAELRQKVEREAKIISPIINRNAFSLARQAIAYGDSYARIYTDKRKGVVDLMNNRFTAPALIMPFEQAGRTIGFHALEDENMERTIAKLSLEQMLRVKMPRIENIPQANFDIWQDKRTLIYDIRAENPILPSEIGGSFLYPIEDVWKDVTISRAGLNNQQIADSVKQAFLTLNMEGMPAVQRKGYIASLTNMLKSYRDQIQDAFEGGEALYGTKYHVLPQYGEKQVLQSIGDLSQRAAPLNEGLLMINLRRLAGGLGMDLSLVGWADMLAGGLGDGAAFHTSAQIMRRSMLIRQACIDAFNHLMSLHWGIKYNEYFEPKDYPWEFDFYSDQSAAATEMLSNKQNRANTLALVVQALTGLKELGLNKETNQLMLEDVFGADLDLADRIAEGLSGSGQIQGMPGAASMVPGAEDGTVNEQAPDSQSNDDDLPDDLEWE